MVKSQWGETWCRKICKQDFKENKKFVYPAVVAWIVSERQIQVDALLHEIGGSNPASGIIYGTIRDPLYMSKMCVISLLGNEETQLTKLFNQSDLRPRSEPVLKLHSRAASSAGVIYRSSGPNTGSNSRGGWIVKKLCRIENNWVS